MSAASSSKLGLQQGRAGTPAQGNDKNQPNQLHVPVVLSSMVHSQETLPGKSLLSAPVDPKQFTTEFQGNNINTHFSYVYVQQIALVEPLERVFPCLRGSAPDVPSNSVDCCVLLKQHDGHETLLTYIVIIRGVLMVVYCLLLISVYASEDGIRAEDGSTLEQCITAALCCLPQIISFFFYPAVRSTKPYRIPTWDPKEPLELELLKYALKVQQEQAFAEAGQDYYHMASRATLTPVELASQSVECSDFHIFSVFPAPPAWAAAMDNDHEQPELYSESQHTVEHDSVPDVDSPGEPNCRSLSSQVTAATVRGINAERQAHNTCQCVMYNGCVLFQMKESGGWSLAAVLERILSQPDSAPAEFFLVYKPTTTSIRMSVLSTSATSSTAAPVLHTVALNSWHVEQSLRDSRIVVAWNARWCYLLIVLIALAAIAGFTDLMPTSLSTFLFGLIGILSLVGATLEAAERTG